MSVTTVLFDLDGTLLPMDQDVFVKAYLGGLCKKLAPLGYDPKAVADGIWKGTGAMVKNDGSRPNEEVFWQVFCGFLGEDARKDTPVFEDFYRNEFQQVAAVCGCLPESRALIDRLKAKGLRLVLATNPIFPAIATHSRVRWAGLQPEDFDYITTYENSAFCKPNPAYYREILDKLGLKPEECLMVGNDPVEDVAAAKLGLPVFLLTHSLIEREGVDVTKLPHGRFEELKIWLDGQI
jgi:HAD superfamily hydrolase (TIGR01549 family)